jgi:SET domain-containing protein
MKIIHEHIIFFALRDIQPGEEITLDYVESYHPDTKLCRCRSASCRRTINLRMK